MDDDKVWQRGRSYTVTGRARRRMLVGLRDIERGVEFAHEALERLRSEVRAAASVLLTPAEKNAIQGALGYRIEAARYEDGSDIENDLLEADKEALAGAYVKLVPGAPSAQTLLDMMHEKRKGRHR